MYIRDRIVSKTFDTIQVSDFIQNKPYLRDSVDTKEISV